jgi:hypothetical protein
LTLLEIAGETHVVMWRQEQARAFPFQPLADRCDFFLSRLLL